MEPKYKPNMNPWAIFRCFEPTNQICVARFRRRDGLSVSSIGLGITLTVRHHARRLCDLQREEHSTIDGVAATSS